MFWIIPKGVKNVDAWLSGKGSAYYIPSNGKRGAKPSQSLIERDAEFIRLYTKEAKTLQEIGNIYGVTRELVRQRLKKCGLAGEIGGGRLRTALNKAHAPKVINKFERKCFDMFGCSREFRDRYGSYQERGSILRAYIDQRKNAKSRKIEWELTFPEWLEIWQESGHLKNRGIGLGKYVMSRMCDIGAYSKENVVIKTHEENSRESREVDAIKGRWVSVEYNGVSYQSLNALCKALKLNTGTVYNRIKNLGYALDQAIETPIKRKDIEK